MKHELAILGLWAIALVATLALVKETGVFTDLAPLYAICAIGSVLIVRSARAHAAMPRIGDASRAIHRVDGMHSRERHRT